MALNIPLLSELIFLALNASNAGNKEETCPNRTISRGRTHYMNINAQ